MAAALYSSLTSTRADKAKVLSARFKPVDGRARTHHVLEMARGPSKRVIFVSIQLLPHKGHERKFRTLDLS